MIIEDVIFMNTNDNIEEIWTNKELSELMMGLHIQSTKNMHVSIILEDILKEGFFSINLVIKIGTLSYLIYFIAPDSYKENIHNRIINMKYFSELFELTDKINLSGIKAMKDKESKEIALLDDIDNTIIQVSTFTYNNEIFLRCINMEDEETIININNEYINNQFKSIIYKIIIFQELYFPLVYVPFPKKSTPITIIINSNFIDNDEVVYYDFVTMLRNNMKELTNEYKTYNDSQTDLYNINNRQ